MAFPIAGYISDPIRTQGEGKDAWEDWLAATRQLLGAQDEAVRSIANGAMAADSSLVVVDTEGGSGADTLERITVATGSELRVILLRCADMARVVTLKHGLGGIGQLMLAGARDAVLDDPMKAVLLYKSGDAWREVARNWQAAASSTLSGLVELATNAEALAKTDATRALTPANLSALGATADMAGLVELATDAEAQAGTDTTRAVTPAGLAATLAPINLMGVPAGAVSHFARSTAPAGWLVCDGRAVSRVTYSGLFDAIGTAFGVGDGSTTFNVPDLRGEFVRCWNSGVNPSGVTATADAGRVFGSGQADELRSHQHSISCVTRKLDGGSTTGRELYGSGTTEYTGLTGGAETRPCNIALLTCIKT